MHARLCWPCPINRLLVAPANVSELAAASALAEGTSGRLFDDRDYHAPRLSDELASQGLLLLAPSRWASRDPDPAWVRLRTRFRHGIDTTFGQSLDRYRAKRVWVRDAWHLWDRLLRKLLSYWLASTSPSRPSIRPCGSPASWSPEGLAHLAT